MGFYSLPVTLPEEAEQFAAQIREYRAGAINPVQFKGVRVAHGVYEQRKENTHMVRIRIASGAVTPAQLRCVAELSKRYGAAEFHVTTRQDLQLHYIDLEDIETIYKELMEVGISSRGGGGNTIRNITAPADSGVAVGETFDVEPYVIALTERLIAEADSWNLPRKFKISFSNSDVDRVGVLVTCLGFVAKLKDGEKGFRVYTAGGQGASPILGRVLYDWVAADRVYYIARAIKSMFDRYGNRRQRAKARIKFLWDKLGEETFRAHMDTYLAEIEKTPGLELKLPEIKNEAKVREGYAPEEAADAAAFATWRKRHVTPQKQAGLYMIRLPLILGDIWNDEGIALANFLANFGDNSLRAGVDQNVYFRNIPEAYLGNVFNQVMGMKSLSDQPVLFTKMVTCTGAATCKLGICLPRGVTPAIQDALTAAGLDTEALADVRIHLSGCPNACAVPHMADIGFFGRVGKSGKDMYPGYNIVVGAITTEGEAQFASKVDEIAARHLPEFFVEFFGRYLAKKDQYANFTAYVNNGGRVEISEICTTLRETVPTLAENGEFFRDWGDSERFSLLKGQKAECSASMFDMIDVDARTLKSIKKEWTGDLAADAAKELAHNMVFHAARMLLITRGIEAKDDAEVYKAFRQHFIQANLVPETFTDLIAVAQAQDDVALAARKDDVIALGDHMLDLYKSMDDSLKFSLPEPAAAVAATNPVAQKVDGATMDAEVFKDLRGVQCPLNFVKVKLALDPMQAGQTMHVLLDDGEPIRNVPRSSLAEGHKVLAQERMADGHWSVVIEKGVGGE